jgi:hypothetical protein
VVMTEGRGLERAVARVRQHDPFTAPAITVVLENFHPVRLAGPVRVEKIAEIEQHPVVLCNERAPRTPVEVQSGRFFVIRNVSALRYVADSCVGAPPMKGFPSI